MKITKLLKVAASCAAVCVTIGSLGFSEAAGSSSSYAAKKPTYNSNYRTRAPAPIPPKKTMAGKVAATLSGAFGFSQDEVNVTPTTTPSTYDNGTGKVTAGEATVGTVENVDNSNLNDWKFGFSGGVDYYFTNNFSLGLDVTWLTQYDFKTQLTAGDDITNKILQTAFTVDADSVVTPIASQDVGIAPVNIIAKYSFNPSTKTSILPFVGAGVGYTIDTGAGWEDTSFSDQINFSIEGGIDWGFGNNLFVEVKARKYLFMEGNVVYNNGAVAASSSVNTVTVNLDNELELNPLLFFIGIKYVM